jgi:hypothetical protein
MLADNAAEASQISVDPQGRLVASFPSSREFCREACQRPANLQKLEAALAEASGREVRLTLATHDDPDGDEPIAAPAKSRRRQLAEASKLPLVQKAMELFDGDPNSLKYSPPNSE